MTRAGGGWELRYEGIKIKEGLVPRPWALDLAQGPGLGPKALFDLDALIAQLPATSFPCH